MNRILLAPSRYVQGAGAIKDVGIHAARLGESALVTGGSTALKLCGEDLGQSLALHGVAAHQELFLGVSSQAEVDRLARLASEKGAAMVIAVGGGAAIDAGKAVSHQLALPVLVVPTTVASDAPCSALSVLYTPEGVFERYLFLRRNPDCVLVDTALVAKSPARFLVAGMGDALAGVWETATCARSGRGNAFCGGDTPTLAALAMSQLCYRTLLASGLEAKLAVERGVVTPAVDAIVEANTLISGLSSENGGHAAAHSIHNGLTTLPATRNVLHGEKVAFGVLAQLVLEGHPREEIQQVQDFCLSVGLPVCLAELNLPAPTREEIRQVAEAAVAEGETIHATWFPVDADMVEAAIHAADALGESYRKQRMLR